MGSHGGTDPAKIHPMENRFLQKAYSVVLTQKYSGRFMVGFGSGALCSNCKGRTAEVKAYAVISGQSDAKSTGILRFLTMIMGAH